MNDPLRFINAYLDEELLPEEAVHLNTWLDADPAHVDTLVRHCHLHWQLHEAIAAEAVRTDALRLSCLAAPANHDARPVRYVRAERLPWFTPRWIAAATAVALLLCLAMAWLHWLPPAPQPDVVRQFPAPPKIAESLPKSKPLAPLSAKPVAETMHQVKPTLQPPKPDRVPIAMLVGAADAVWKEGMLNETSHLLLPGRLELRSGVAKLSFNSGATAILEGPVALDLITTLEGRLTRGKLMATVPDEARGFCIHTPGASVVDLGTQFGVSVDASGTADVHVLAGRVDVASPGQPTQRIFAGHAVRAVSVTGQVKVAPIAYQPGLFVQSLRGGSRWVPVSADAYVHSASPGTNFGSQPRLVVQSIGRTFDTMWVGYLRFDLPTDASQVKSARVRLCVSENIDTGTGHGSHHTVSVFGLNDDRAGRRWAERTLAWRNAPALLPDGKYSTLGRIDETRVVPLGRFMVPSAAMPGTAPPPQCVFTAPALSDFLNEQFRLGQPALRTSVTLILVREAPRSETENLGFYTKECGDQALAPAMDLILDGVAPAPDRATKSE